MKSAFVEDPTQKNASEKSAILQATYLDALL